MATEPPEIKSKGIFLDPRTWKIDYRTSPYWNPEEYGLKIDLHPDAFGITRTGVAERYKFAIATEVWERPMHKSLRYLRSLRGLKIFMVPREIAPLETHIGIMFNEKKFSVGGKCYFKPDLVLAPGKQYAGLWEEKARTKIIGYPRFDTYLDKEKWKDKSRILSKFGISENKKIIFFPSYPPFVPNTENGKNVTVDLADDLQNTLEVFEKFAMNNKDFQVISKIHPYSQKCYNKRIGRGDEVSGLLEKYYKHPTDYMRVIGDRRNNSNTSREMIVIADFVVGYTSMMLLEAIINKKPVLHLRMPQSMKVPSMPLYSESIKTIYGFEGMFDALGDIGQNPDEYVVKSNEIIEYYLHKVDGKFCERLCKEILEEMEC
jgi:hypothetical protein